MQIRYLILLFGLALLTLIGGTARPVWQPGVIEGTSTAVSPEIETWLTDEMSRRGVPGMAVAGLRWRHPNSHDLARGLS